MNAIGGKEPPMITNAMNKHDLLKICRIIVTHAVTYKSTFFFIRSVILTAISSYLKQKLLVSDGFLLVYHPTVCL